MPPPRIYLASRSPRRRELLAQIGVEFEPIAGDIDERPRPGERPAAYVRRMAAEKAEAGRRGHRGDPDVPVLAADTAVVLGETILGKPEDPSDAERMLGALSGREHRVLSAVALEHRGAVRVRLCESTVRFRAIEPAERRAYCAGPEPLDKAGAYAVQGLGAVFVESLAGSYSGVMGLPLFETAELLAGAGLVLLRDRTGR